MAELENMVIIRAIFFFALSIVSFGWLSSSGKLDLLHATLAGLFFCSLFVVSYLMAKRCKKLSTTTVNVIASRIFFACMAINIANTFVPFFKIFSA